MTCSHVVVIEQDEVIRCGLATMLRQADATVSCTTLEEPTEFQMVLSDQASAVDVVIVGSREDSAQVLRIAEKFERAVRILLIVATADPNELTRAVEADVDGYIVREHLSTMQLSEALSRISRGEVPVPSELTNYLSQRARDETEPCDCIESLLSPRELEVLALLVDGMSNKQISQVLTISVHGTKRHVSSMLRKSGCQNRSTLVSRTLRPAAVSAPSESTVAKAS